jgi:hypothetical protein
LDVCGRLPIGARVVHLSQQGSSCSDPGEFELVRPSIDAGVTGNQPDLLLLVVVAERLRDGQASGVQMRQE